MRARPSLLAPLAVAAAVAIQALAGLAAATDQSQPVQFDRDVPHGVYGVTSLPVPDVAWARFTVSLNWTAAALIDVYLMKCNDTDAVGNGTAFATLYSGAGAAGNAHASVLARNYTEPDVCLVLDNTEGGAVAPSRADPVHVDIDGVETASDREDDAIAAGAGASGGLVLVLLFVLAFVGAVGVVAVIGYRFRHRADAPQAHHQAPQQVLPPGPPPPGWPPR